LKVDLFVAILLKYWSCLTSVRYNLLHLNIISLFICYCNFSIDMLCTVCLRIKGYIKVCNSIDHKKIAVSNSNQYLVNVICYSINKFESWSVCRHSAKILILFNFSKIPPFHQLQTTTTKLRTNSKQYHYMFSLRFMC
jgi:hypothetical protein